jgi:DNA-binding IclR family transcriptional regulator
LERTGSKTGETTHLAVREGRQAFFIHPCASTRQIVAVSGQTGEFVPLHSTAHGKALLADCGALKPPANRGPNARPEARRI